MEENKILSKSERVERDSNTEVVNISVDKISDNPFQPRKKYPEKEIKSLAKSISERGIFQPITVVKNETGFIIIGGHRRFRAFKKLGRKTVPCIVREQSSSKDMVLDVVIENSLRKDFNPEEKATSILNVLSLIKNVNNDVNKAMSLLGSLKNLKKRGAEHVKLIKGAAASFEYQDLNECQKYLKLLDMSENTCTKYLRLLLLPESIRKNVIMIQSNELKKEESKGSPEISCGIAYEISRVKGEKLQKSLYDETVKKNYTAIQLRCIIDELLESGQAEKLNKLGRCGRDKKDYGLNDLIDETNRLGNKLWNFRAKFKLLELSLDKICFRAGLKKLKKSCMALIENIDIFLEDDNDIYDYKDVDDSFEITLTKGKGGFESRFTFPSKVFKRLNISHNDILVLKIDKIKRKVSQ